MLSESIDALHEHLAKFSTDGLILEAEGVVGLTLILKVWSEEARELEQIARTVAQHHGLSESVLRIAAMLDKNNVAVGMPARGQDGGLVVVPS